MGHWGRCLGLRERKYQQDGENFRLTSGVVVDIVRWTVNVAWTTRGRREMHTVF